MSDVETRQTMTNYDMLTPTQRLFVVARARGKTITQATKEANIARNTPATNWDMDMINAAILEVQHQQLRDSAQAVAHILPRAIIKLERAVEKGDLGAIRETFDRVWGKPPQRQELTGKDGDALIPSLTAEEKAQALEAYAIQQTAIATYRIDAGSDAVA